VLASRLKRGVERSGSLTETYQCRRDPDCPGRQLEARERRSGRLPIPPAMHRGIRVPVLATGNVDEDITIDQVRHGSDPVLADVTSCVLTSQLSTRLGPRDAPQRWIRESGTINPMPPLTRRNVLAAPLALASRRWTGTSIKGGPQLANLKAQ